MKQKEFFQTHILPYLDDIINWKVVLFLDEETAFKKRPKMVYTADTKSDSASSQIWML